MTYSSGAYWEERARQLIESEGATVIARNYTCRFGEIDLIALDRDRLTFIEVRYRNRSDFGSALASVSPAKQQRVLMTAQMFLASHEDYCNRYCRFDIIAFDGPRGSVSAQWLKGAFGLAEYPNYE
ncbi:MAG: YraN family protein [Pseudomonadota bacterium]|nr:YraN family protein [Pseudomonadota bacterium]|tara:strand:+ start:959 stop:1336 length:378 start_codon:yes stop_codon:yes gene_type:complete